MINGILALNKPTGMTSKSVSRSLKKYIGDSKIGHVGTLDPLAEGVLLILIGKSTRLQDELLGGEKKYDFELEFGYETTTLDCEGDVVCKDDNTDFSHLDLDTTSKTLIGPLKQIPPLYSAVKVQGKPLYSYARRGKQLPINSLQELTREVQIYDLRLLSHVGRKATFSVLCSKGTYVRSLGQSIASAHKTYATVTKLKRVYSSGIHLNKCIDLEKLLAFLERGESLEKFLISKETILLNKPLIKVNCKKQESKLKNGIRVLFSPTEFDSRNLSVETASDDSTVFVANMDDTVIGFGKISIERGIKYVTLNRRLI